MIDIIHTPKGQEHPYVQGPEERVPREPLAGETFTVGIAIRPPGAVSQVRVHTRLDDQPGPTVDAVRNPDWEAELEAAVGMDLLDTIVRVEQDVWRAQLTAPEIGHTLVYWIEAGDQTTPRYTLRGESWVPAQAWVPPLREAGPGVWEMILTPAVPSPSAVETRLPALHQIAWLHDGTDVRRVRLVFDCVPEEAFFGLGERFNALNQRGETLDVRCYDQYKNQGKRTYIPIPFLLSSAGYGVYVDSPRWMKFDLADSQPDHWRLEADLGPDGALRLVWFVDDDPVGIIRKFAALAGLPALPPLWAFGLWMSSNNEWDSQARVLREVEQTETHGIDASVVVIEAWSDESTFYIWNDAQYAPTSGGQSLRYADFTFPPAGRWPDPKGLVETLHGKGLRVILWQNPVMKQLDEPHAQHEADRAYFEQKRFGVLNSDGSLYRIRSHWFRDGYLWDVTNPTAREWWFAKRAYLLDDLGVDGFKTDGGEHLWGVDTLFWDGRQGDELGNLYPRLYTEAYHRFAAEKRHGDSLTFSRAGFVGSQCAPAHWAGDENSTWDAFRHSILAGLSAGISGIPFWGWDLGGFNGEIPTAELYLRSAAMAAFCPIMQYHCNYNEHRETCRDRTPWNIQARTGDERVIPFFRFLVNVRRNLMPYIWQEAQHTARTGEPLMRALGLWHRAASPYQYYFGRDLLVCPVVNESAETWPVYLPDGEWVDLWTESRFAGGEIVNVPAPLDRIPVFVRQGARIPVRLGSGHALGDHVALTDEPNAVLSFDD
jgi:alpha-D-xyloside xylohydrolase